jgi:ATP-dependent helicase/nuclease subunit A
MLVEASAGTGKTRSMVDRMIALLREGKCGIGSLAAITFTRKAAAELRARFQVALEKAARQAEGEAGLRLRVRSEIRLIFLWAIW